MLETYGVMVGRLLMATLLGGAVGLQRERGNRPAGFRTHMLVCVGAALITILSDSYPNSDGRIAAQIVSGIGFLGAGTIIREGASVKGLTTAASLWAVAGVGMAVGHSNLTMWLAAVATLLIYMILSAGKFLEDHLDHGEHGRMLFLRLDPSALPALLEKIQRRNLRADIVGGGQDSDGALRLHLQFRSETGHHRSFILKNILEIPGIKDAVWDTETRKTHAE